MRLRGKKYYFCPERFVKRCCEKLKPWVIFHESKKKICIESCISTCLQETLPITAFQQQQKIKSCKHG